MLGLIGRPAALAAPALDAFYPLCTEGKVRPNVPPGHLDGWGIAGYEQSKPIYFGRRPTAATDDPKEWKAAAQRAGALASPVLLAHFRKASKGARSLENTHPFQKNGWLFCHNGTVENYEQLPLKKYRPEGQTDSERLFLHLLEVLDAAPADRAAALKDALARVQKDFSYTSLTFLLSDGASLYAYRSYSDHALGPGENAATRGATYTLWTAEAERVQLVCSEPVLTEKIRSWTPIPNNELAVF